MRGKVSIGFEGGRWVASRARRLLTDASTSIGLLRTEHGQIAPHERSPLAWLSRYGQRFRRLGMRFLLADDDAYRFFAGVGLFASSVSPLHHRDLGGMAG